MAKEDILKKLEDAVLNGDDESVPDLCQQALSEGLDPTAAINDGLAPGVRAAGEKFSCGEYFLPQLVRSGEAMKAGMKILLPKITDKAKGKAKGKILIGCVNGDVHDIGKGIVVALMTAAGFEVLDLGVDIPAADFLGQVKSEAPYLLGLGSYMSTTLPAMEAVIEELKKAGLRDKVKVIIGGVAATREYASRIGADGFAPDAPRAVKLAEKLVGGA